MTTWGARRQTSYKLRKTSYNTSEKLRDRGALAAGTKGTRHVLALGIPNSRTASVERFATFIESKLCVLQNLRKKNNNVLRATHPDEQLGSECILSITGKSPLALCCSASCSLLGERERARFLHGGVPCRVLIRNVTSISWSVGGCLREPRKVNTLGVIPNCGFIRRRWNVY